MVCPIFTRAFEKKEIEDCCNEKNVYFRPRIVALLSIKVKKSKKKGYNYVQK
tara:strand:+ start:573 stop:728 length:156 start_codon:yes stop_codon:yes gene_type:complete